MLQRIQQIWQQAGFMQRVVLVGTALGFIVAAVVLIGWARQPEMSLLYNRLSPEEASRIVEKIRDANVAYELKDGGTTIYVPAKEVYGLRLSMAQDGLPTDSNKGYQILDDQKIGQSPFVQRVNHIRAIEGELAKSIQTLDAVASARVHLARPEASLFEKEKQATATVVLKLKGGYRLSPSNISSIVHLVAGGVEDLLPEKVVVVDSRGKLLSGEDDDPVVQSANSVLDYKTQVEEYLSSKAEEMLTAVLGPNRASVEVSAVLEMSSKEQTTEMYVGEKPPVSKEITKSKKSNSGGTTEEQPSTETNEETIDTEYFPPSRTVERMADLPGQITKLSASALVDLSPPGSPAAEGETAREAQPPLKVEEVKEIIANAIGLDESRGDQLTVKEAVFAGAATPPPAPPQETGFFSKELLLEIARRLSLGILVVGALLALKMFTGTKKGEAEAQQQQAQLQSQAAGHAGLLPHEAQSIGPDALRRQITQALQENPDEVKRLFLSWVESEKGAS